MNFKAKFKIASVSLLLTGSSVFSEGYIIGMPKAHAQNAHACMQIQNEDRRNYCAGKATSNSSICGMIKGLDLRNLCMAQVQRNRSICGMIKDPDMRAECNASM
jgi:hypothetical protein